MKSTTAPSRSLNWRSTAQERQTGEKTLSGVETFAWVANALALGFGVAIGLRGLLDPKWATRTLGLQPGVFIGVHIVALAFSTLWLWKGAIQGGMWASGAAAALSAGWFGACGGRILTMLRDAASRRVHLRTALIEFVMGVMIGAPWLLWIFVTPS